MPTTFNFLSHAVLQSFLLLNTVFYKSSTSPRGENVLLFLQSLVHKMPHYQRSLLRTSGL